MDSYSLHAGFLGSPVHLVVQVALGHLKDPLVWLDFVEGFQVIPDLVRQKCGIWMTRTLLGVFGSVITSRPFSL